MNTGTVMEFLGDQLADPETAWSLGTFGAIAEFTRDTNEVAVLRRDDREISIITGRGGMRIRAHAGLRPIASESLTTESWGHRVALCLPEEAAAMNGRAQLTELGPDTEALRDEDRTSILFDLGLGAVQVDACIRTSDPAVIEALRQNAGKSVFEPDSSAMSIILSSSPHRVFISRIGRVEVFQPIPPPGGKSPDGPHTHVLPKLLAHGRAHAATEPLPAGWIPCAHCYPPHPFRDAFGHRRPFQRDRHTAFQLLHARYGDPQLVELKRRVVDAVMAGHEPSAIAVHGSRFARAMLRVALRQLQASEQTSPALAAWLSAHDRFDPGEREETTETHR